MGIPARVKFRHLSGPRSGEVDEVTLPAVLGSGPGAHVRAAPSAPRHALVFEREGEIVLRGKDPGAETWLDGEAVRDAVLREGDVLRLGPDGPLVRLEAGGEPSEGMLTTAPWEHARWSLASLRALAGSAYARIAISRRRSPHRNAPGSNGRWPGGASSTGCLSFSAPTCRGGSRPDADRHRRRCRVDRGEYPAALDDLAPAYLGAIPVDPFTGRPPEYARDGAGFVLRSAGAEVEREAQHAAPGSSRILEWRIPR